MRAVGVGLALLLALGAAYFALQQSARSDADRGAPQEQIDVVAIRQTLLVLAQAERQYLATHGTYGTLDQLKEEDLLAADTEARGYALSIIVRGSTGFTIMATPTGANKGSRPTLYIRENMQVTER